MRKPKRPKDVNQLAGYIASIATGETTREQPQILKPKRKVAPRRKKG